MKTYANHSFELGQTLIIAVFAVIAHLVIAAVLLEIRPSELVSVIWKISRGMIDMAAALIVLAFVLNRGSR